jgi:hypothetical protein
MSMEIGNTRSVARRGVIAVRIAAAVSLVSVPAEATPLDKLSGQSITVGNLVFSNFSWPSFSGAGPSNIDVQGVVVTDPATGQQQAGLRFVVIQSGAQKPFSLSPQGGPHEIVFTIDYSVTNISSQLTTIAHSINATVSGQAGVFFVTNASDALNVTAGSLADPALTMLASCNWFGIVCSGSSSASPTSFAVVASGDLSQSAPLFPGITTYYVQHQVQLQISNRKGVPGGTVTLQGWDALFSE